MAKKNTQFLSAKFKLRPSKRKAALLQYVSQTYDDAFWDMLCRTKDTVAKVVPLETKKERNESLADIYNRRNLLHYGLSGAVTDGLSRDLMASASSYVELIQDNPDTQWPTKPIPSEDRYEQGLDQLAESITKEDEDAARDDIYRGTKPYGLRPITLARGRECQLRRTRPNGPVVAVLLIQNPKDKKAKRATVHAGFDAATGEPLNTLKSNRVVAIPVEMSKHHENKFCNGVGNVKLVSGLITYENGDWFLVAQFAMTVDLESRHMNSFKDYSNVDHVIGIDRGCCITAAVAIVSLTGKVKHICAPRGGDIGKTIKQYEEENKRYQKRKGIMRKGHYDAVEQILHEIANNIIRLAKQYNAAISIEDLDSLKDVIVKKRVNGSRRRGWRKTLKKMQLRKLEEILNYKLHLAGLPDIIKVPARGTSRTCSACGHYDEKSRKTQDTFVCTECGIELHADFNASAQIARRGVMNVCKMLKKGVKLNDIHKDMVSGLSDQNDGGLGPLVASAADGLVAAPDAEHHVYVETGTPATLADVSGQKITINHQNHHENGVFAERVGHDILA